MLSRLRKAFSYLACGRNCLVKRSIIILVALLMIVFWWALSFGRTARSKEETYDQKTFYYDQKTFYSTRVDANWHDKGWSKLQAFTLASFGVADGNVSYTGDQIIGLFGEPDEIRNNALGKAEMFLYRVSDSSPPMNVVVFVNNNSVNSIGFNSGSVDIDDSGGPEAAQDTVNDKSEPKDTRP